MKRKNVCKLSLCEGGCALVLIAATATAIGDVSASPASAPGAATNSVTLESLVSEALAHNPELNFYKAEIAAAKAGRRSAAAWRNPELAGSIGQKSVREGDLAGEGVAWSVSVMQPFEWPGRIGLRKAIANRDVELAELGFERFRAALGARVRGLAYGLFAAQKKAAAAEEVAERFAALKEVLVQRDPAGLTPLLETRVIEATELNAQRKASEAILSTKAALFELNQLRGLGPGDWLAVTETPLRFREAEPAGKLQAMALTNNFEVRVRAAELAQQGFRVDLARNERYPAISLGPSISEERAGDRERTIGLGVSVPLPLWNRNQGSIETAKARQAQAETSLFVAQREVERKVAEAALTYETKVREMARWRDDAVEHFRDAAELADRHYRLGAVPISTYVELQKQYLEAVEGLLDTRKEALEAAAQLELLTGLPTPLATAAEGAESK
jgi:cobalt-zinc-cadmium efflux system outer membrane protein